MTAIFRLKTIIRFTFLFVCLHTAVAAYSLETVFSDSMSLCNERKPEQSLANSAMEKGDTTWYVDGSVVFRADGTATSAKSTGGTAYHPLPFAGYRYKISAEVNASSTSCTVIALGCKIPLGVYFQTTMLSLMISPDGGYEIMARGFGRIKSGTKADYPDFKEGGFTKLELEYDSVKNSVTARINGGKIMDAEELVSKKIGPFFTYASFRFNGPLTPGAPCLKNYSVTLTHEKAPEETRPSNEPGKIPEKPFNATL